MRDIPQDRIDAGKLTLEEVEYLKQRDRLSENHPQFYDVDLAPQGRSMAQTPNTGDVNTTGKTVEELRGGAKKLDDGLNHLGDKSEEDEEEESQGDQNYENMTNDERRAELVSRGLTTTGKKSELIARLERSDADELEEGDEPEEDEDEEEDEGE